MENTLNSKELFWSRFLFISLTTVPYVLISYFYEMPYVCFSIFAMIFVKCKDPLFGNRGKYFYVRQSVLFIFGTLTFILGQ